MGNENILILVTGATGKVGRAAVTELLARGARVRAFVRDPATANLPAAAEIVRGDIDEPATFAPALDGVTGVFLIWPGLDAEAARPFLDAARHVRHVVYLSARGIRDNAATQGDPITGFHADMERLVGKSGPDWTFLRAGGFAGNTLGWAHDVRTEGVVRQPYPGLSRPLVHEKDLAEVGALALLEDGHAGRSYDLTGPESLTQLEQMDAISAAIGTPLRFEDLAPEEAKSTLLGGFPPEIADEILDAWKEMATTPETVSTTVRDLLGRPATPFATWARDHADDFR
ncbi:NAD(P)H-binding protein [Amycolatopsis sp. H20-H5]|uniref:NAD(P)H-binding protein n=1 Tax=Amycolatopsis sp. H20-H5 TaxID=3046309 RepID=UPI002DB8908A|nr:NAD(P)H-binding protein [Amycolatopsis sp. H20-H5]MEC3979349.1 NAD(P)H-binding protein [Amycolatopsis sp. H20-H5]